MSAIALKVPTFAVRSRYAASAYMSSVSSVLSVPAADACMSANISLAQPSLV